MLTKIQLQPSRLCIRTPADGVGANALSRHALVHSKLMAFDEAELSSKQTEEEEEVHDQGPFAHGCRRLEACVVQHDHWDGSVKEEHNKTADLVVLHQISF